MNDTKYLLQGVPIMTIKRVAVTKYANHTT